MQSKNVSTVGTVSLRISATMSAQLLLELVSNVNPLFWFSNSNKFGFFDKKFACGICKRVVCVTDSRLQQLMPPATASMTICRKCNTYIAFHFHQAEQKRKLAEAQNNIALIFYTTLMAIKDEVVHELPKFRGIVFTLSSIFGDTPEQQEKIREMVDDGGPLLFPGRTLEELFTQGVASQKRLKSVFSALEERLAGIQAASNDTKTQQRMISNLKQAMHDFLQHSLPLFRFSAQRLAEIRDHPKTKRLLIAAKEQIRQEEINAARRLQEEADRKRYKALVGDEGSAPAFAHGAAGAHLNANGSSQNRSGSDSFLSKVSHKAHQVGHSGNSILHAAWNSISKPMENLDEAHYIPEISAITPAICPSMGGLPLSIKGFNFHPNARVYVGEKKLEEWQVLWKSPEELTVISPQSDNEGPLDVSVENPNQVQRGVLESVLFFTSDPDIMASLFGSVTFDTSQPSSSAPPIHSSSTSSIPSPRASTSNGTHSSTFDRPSSNHHHVEPIPTQPPGYTSFTSTNTAMTQPLLQPTISSHNSAPINTVAPVNAFSSAISSSPDHISTASSAADPPSYTATNHFRRTSTSPPAYQSVQPQFSLPPGYSVAAPTPAYEQPVSSTKTHIKARTFGKEPHNIPLDNSRDGNPSWG